MPPDAGDATRRRRAPVRRAPDAEDAVLRRVLERALRDAPDADAAALLRRALERVLRAAEDAALRALRRALPGVPPVGLVERTRSLLR